MSHLQKKCADVTLTDKLIRTKNCCINENEKVRLCRILTYPSRSLSFIGESGQFRISQNIIFYAEFSAENTTKNLRRYKETTHPADTYVCMFIVLVCYWRAVN